MDGHPTTYQSWLPVAGERSAGGLVAKDVGLKLAFWKDKLAGAPDLLQLPTDHPRRSGSQYVPESTDVRLSSVLTAGLRRLAEQEGTTLTEVLLASWVVLLARWSAQEEVLVGAQLCTESLQDSASGPADNAVTLRVDLSGQPTLREYQSRFSAVLKDAVAHQGVPFEKVAEAIREEHGSAPALQVMIRLESGVAQQSVETLRARLADRAAGSSARARTPFELTVSLAEMSGEVLGIAQYATELFERQTIERMVASWQSLLGGMQGGAQEPIGHLPLLSATERTRVIQELNQTAQLPVHDCLIHELFEAQVERTPREIAVIHDGATINFDELNRKANQLARHLREVGVGADQVVALCMERSLDMVVGMLAILKAGGAYVPMDPAYPAERLSHMLRDSAARILVTQDHLLDRLPQRPEKVVLVDVQQNDLARYEDSNISRAVTGVMPSRLAYVIYTSGSTGLPKGATNEHRGMVNRLLAQAHIEGLTAGDICCQKTSISFVDAVFEIFGALCTGCPLVIIPAEAVTDSAEMAALIAKSGVTRLITVPSLARSMLESPEVIRDLKGLRTWTLSGEEVRADLVIKLQEQLPDCDIINLYGSSEVSSDAATYRTHHFRGERFPVGRPVPNVRIYILDQYGEPVPQGVVGEIYVGGIGVGRGYLNRPDLTVTRFVSDPFSPEADGRLYKTGDLGRWRADGYLECLGRSDHQVKIRGFRIELGEIEARLLQVREVREAVVLAREDVPGDKRLVAYVTARDTSEPPLSSETLRTQLKAILPEFMIPVAFVWLPSMPLTPNGKLNRRALPVPDAEAYSLEPYEAPQSELERILAGIWQDVLGVARVGRRERFFDLGGHSLLMLRVLERLKKAGRWVPVRRLFENPTLAELACGLTRADSKRHTVPANLIPVGSQAITPEMLPLVELTQTHINDVVGATSGGAANIQDIYPLAPLQEGILFHHLLDLGATDAYVASVLLSVSSQERLRELIASLDAVIARHDVLRTAVLWEQTPSPVQVVYRRAELPVAEVVLEEGQDALQQVKELLRSARPRLDLRKAPLMRLTTVEDRRRKIWYALLDIHHIVDDDISRAILVDEVVAQLRGDAQGLSEPVPYRNHVAMALESSRTTEAEHFFRGRVGDVEEPTAPFGLTNVLGDGSELDELRQELPVALAQRIRSKARKMGVSPATLFHVVWALVLARTSARDDVVFGSVFLGRMQGVEGTGGSLGMLINTLPVRLKIKRLTAKELVEQAHHELTELISHEHAFLALAQRSSGIAGSTPLFSSVLNYRHEMRDPAQAWAHAQGISLVAAFDRTNYPITLSIDDLGERFALTVQTDRRIEPSRIAGYVQEAMSALIGALEHAPETLALALPVLPALERQQVIELFNATQAEYPENALIQVVFEEQVRRTPEAVAVIYEGQSLSYAELNTRANQLAHYLRSQGVQSGGYVPVLMPRCLVMLIAELAVLKCGAAYVPVDATTPLDRQEFMIRDCGAQLAIGDAAKLSLLALEGLGCVDYERDAEAIARSPTGSPDLDLPSSSPAYVMYTSGSTGTPKGVVVTHRGVNRMAINGGYVQVGPDDRVMHGSNPAFDGATFEIWATLLNGARVLIVRQAVLLDVEQLTHFVEQQQPTVLFLTIGLFTHYADAIAPICPRLRYLITGGDVMDIAAVRRVMRYGGPRQLVNGYGPTECTTFSTTHSVSLADDSASSVPIGRPISNTQVYILNSALQPAPIGVAGEIYIGGPGVAAGYLNRPELTAERFICDPFSTYPHARLYKTGDLGRWRPDGVIEFLGRDDQQVKLRGFRIELGEIKARLQRHPQVIEAIVLAREDVPGDKRLVAYVRPQDEANAEELREYLKGVLPEYMVPSAFVVLRQFPLTPNGKVDKRALLPPGPDAVASREYAAPRGEEEEIVAAVWQEVLQIVRVGRDDNFFELGGHSLLATQMVVRIRAALSIDLPIRVLFDSPRLKEFCACAKEYRNRGLLEKIRGGGDQINYLLEKVASISESELHELLQQLQMEGRDHGQDSRREV